jgi:hypothetical protein
MFAYNGVGYNNPLGTDVNSMSIPLGFNITSMKWGGNKVD